MVKRGFSATVRVKSEITSSLVSLLDDEALRKRMGAAAQVRVKNELIWPVVIDRYLDSFRGC